MNESDRHTELSFSDGGKMSVKGIPDQIVDTIVKSNGQPFRVFDTADYPHWVFPDHVRSLVSYDRV
jgi:hypothetical protein